ncbi:MAG: D-2-hydroxyacid dehydrogenase family protein [Rhodospirillales bacterium]
MNRIGILDDYLNVALDCADWASLTPECAVTVLTEHLSGEDEAARVLRDFDILVAMSERMRFPASLFGKLPNLKLLVSTKMDNPAIDLDAARARGIPVCGTGMISAASEQAWALIMAVVRAVPRENAAMHTGGWQAGLSHSLYKKTLGILGLGMLGRRVAKVGQAFGMRVIAWSQNLTPEACEKRGVEYVDKDTLFKESDVLSLQVRLSERTAGIAGARELSLMKPTAYLINTARGELVDEAALLDTLRNNRIAGAGLDVYPVEPLPADHPLRKLDNVVLTGHMGYVTEENYRYCYAQAVEDIQAWLDGKPIRVMTEGAGWEAA